MPETGERRIADVFGLLGGTSLGRVEAPKDAPKRTSKDPVKVHCALGVSDENANYYSFSGMPFEERIKLLRKLGWSDISVKEAQSLYTEALVASGLEK